MDMTDQLPYGDVVKLERHASDVRRRGRPRVDTRDETAADRRRTQIRLAQRAYRSRKETTISALNRRASILQEVIDEMQRVFLHFNDKVIAFGVLATKPELAMDLREATDSFVTLSSTAQACVDEGSPEMMDKRTHSLDGRAHPLDGRAHPLDGRPHSMDARPHSVDARVNSNQLAISMGMPDILSTSTTTGVLDSNNPIYYQPVTGYWGNSVDYTRRDQMMADPNIAELIKPTYEFARHDSTSLGPSDRLANPKPGDIWLASDRKSASRIPPGVVRLRSAKAPQFSTMARLQPSTDQVGGLETPNKPPLEQFLSGDAIELGLGQRLMRATFRAAYQLLIKAETYPTIYSHCFGLSFYYCTRQQMLRLISYKVLGLAYTTEHGQSPPFIALGGAGSHYGSLGHPIRIEQGKRQPVVRPVSLNSKNFVRLVDESAPYDPGIIADLTGYEGDWFDALDVEEYLAEKNVRLELDPAPTKCNVGHDSASALFTGSKSYTTEGWRGNLSDTITIPITPPDFNGSAATSAPARLPSGTAYSRPGVSLAPRPVSQLPETISADPTSLSIRSFKFLAAWDWQAIEKAGTDRQLVPSWVPPTTAKPTTPDPSLTRIIPSPAGSNLAYGRSTTMTIDGDKFIHALIPKAVCLGRSPGFRRIDVEHAFQQAFIC